MRNKEVSKYVFQKIKKGLILIVTIMMINSYLLPFISAVAVENTSNLDKPAEEKENLNDNNVSEIHSTEDSEVNKSEISAIDLGESENPIIEVEKNENPAQENNEMIISDQEQYNKVMAEVRERSTAIPEFIMQVSENAKLLASQNDLYASVMIAQSILESAHGTSVLGKIPVNNLFGIKGRYNNQFFEKESLEQLPDGTWVTKKSEFRKYESWEKSQLDYVEKIKKGPNANAGDNSWNPSYYAGAWRSNTSSYRDATAALVGKYASDKTYDSKLNQIIETYNLTQFDLPMRAVLDSPLNDMKILENKIDISGWALSTNGISKIDVYLDNQMVGTAVYGIERSDVYSSYPEYENQNSGYQYTINTTNLATGNHKIKIQVFDNNGTSQTLEKAVSKVDTPNRLYVESPSGVNEVIDSLAIKGWGLAVAGITKIEVLVDDRYVSDATIGIERKDVMELFPEYKNANSGFSYQLDTKNLSKGNHKVTIKMCDASGTITSKDSIINKNSLKMLTQLEKPFNNDKVFGQDYKIKGWILAPDELDKIEVFVDGKSKGTAIYGIARNDVYNIYPSYNNKNSGFYYNLDASNLTVGQHKIDIKVTTVIDETQTMSRTFEKIDMPHRLYIDEPSRSEPVSGNQIVRGWTVSEKGIDKVEVFIDGILDGNASINLERLDVQKLFPEYQTSTSGFSYTLDTSKLKVGNHVITIKSYSKKGEINSTDIAIVKPLTKILTSLDNPTTNAKIYGEKYKISGWALSEEKIANIEISVDGIRKGLATYNIERSDVYNAYPKFNNKNAGFEYEFNATKLSEGNHTLKLIFNLENGQTQVIERIIVKPAMPNRLYVDEPVLNKEVGKSEKIRGWALSEKGVSKIEILVDSKLMGQAAINLERKDVYKAFNEYENVNSGFSYDLDTTTLTSGNHNLTIKVYLKDSTAVTSTRIISKKKLEILTMLDSLNDGDKISGANFNVSGWVLADTPVDKIEYVIDGKLDGNALLNISRLDVYKAYPKYDEKNSGFSYAINADKLNSGKHNLNIKISMKNGETRMISRSFIISDLSNKSYLENPTNSLLENNQIVKGWFVSTSSVSKINVLLDNEKVGEAEHNILREDVYNLYPEYDNKNSGFQYLLNAENIPSGKHTLKIELMLSDGGKEIITKEIYKANFPMISYLEAPISNSVVSGIIDVKGWILADEKMARVEVYVDGQINGNAIINILRQDVAGVYPDYKDTNPGFSYKLNTVNLSAGMHELKIIGISNAGRSTIINSTFRLGELAGKKVYVDAGHGGRDPGAISSGVQEKDLNLKVALKLRNNLVNKGATVVMSRDNDQFLELWEITNKANSSNADIFISLHHNSAGESADGIETYSYEGSGSSNRSVFSLFNQNLSESYSVVTPFAANNNFDRLYKSQELAKKIQVGLIDKTGAKDRGAKKTDFHVIRETNMPAVLAELGFITNPAERAKLVTDSYQNKLAQGITEGTVNYFK